MIRARRALALFLVPQRARAKRSTQSRAAAAITEQKRRERDQLVLANMDLVDRNLHSIACRVWAKQFDHADLRAAGFLKLVLLAGEFDASRGVPFKDYARKGVRGAMWELVRRRNWREGSHLALVPEKVKLADTRQTPQELLQLSRDQETARDALTALNDREREIVSRYYGGEDLGTIGASLAISASMASLVHRQALEKMQSYFAIRGRIAA